VGEGEEKGVVTLRVRMSDLQGMNINLVSLALVFGMTLSAAFAEEKKTNHELRRDDAMAWKMAEKFVLANLKAPATAKFTGHSFFRSPPSGRFSVCLALTDLEILIASHSVRRNFRRTDPFATIPMRMHTSSPDQSIRRTLMVP
jgi:hypothetical protein